MLVSMWMTKDVISVTPNTPVTELAKLMADKKIRRLPVVDAKGQLQGLVSAQDVLHAFPPEVNPFAVMSGKTPNVSMPNITAEQIMVCEPLFTAPDTPIEEAARVMQTRKVSALLVMRHDELVGVITESDIFRAFASIFDPDTHGVRITFDNSTGHDVFPLIAEVTHRHRLRVMSFVSLHKQTRPACVVQVTGSEPGIEAMLNDIWKSHHQVMSVIHVQDPNAKPTPAA